MSRRKKKQKIIVLGICSDKSLLLGGSFYFADTLGLPLGEQITQAEKHSCRISILNYAADAYHSGWPQERIIREVKNELHLLGRFK